ncbi:MAG: hypothetical protein HQ579_07475, partial [Candidatus Omnitrophica bacterium]|nr:hypothetical protein [Candidatus Omnitrophota bacterium]
MFTNKCTLYKTILKAVSIVLIHAMLISNVVWAHPDPIKLKDTLSAWSGIDRAPINRVLHAKMLHGNRRIDFVNTDVTQGAVTSYGRLLKYRTAFGYLSLSGKYKLPLEFKDYDKDDSVALQFMRAVYYEDFEVLWQKQEQTNPRYKELQEQILSNPALIRAYCALLPPNLKQETETLGALIAKIIDKFKLAEMGDKSLDEQARTIIFNGIMARAFGVSAMINDTLALRSEFNNQELAFAENIRDILDRANYNLPTVFSNEKERTTVVLELQEKKEEKFYHTADGEVAEDKKEPPESLGEVAPEIEPPVVAEQIPVRSEPNEDSEVASWRGMPIHDVKSLLYPACGIDADTVVDMLNNLPDVNNIHLVDDTSIEDLTLRRIKQSFYSKLEEISDEIVDTEESPTEGNRDILMLKFRKKGSSEWVNVHFHWYDYLQMEAVKGLEEGSDLTIVKNPGLTSLLTKRPYNNYFYEKIYRHTKKYIYITLANPPLDKKLLNKLKILDYRLFAVFWDKNRKMRKKSALELLKQHHI